MNRAAYRLKPWNEVVTPHDDIVSGDLEMATYAADLGGVDRRDSNVPKVYRDAREFFRTKYPTRNLRRLLADILGVLGGGSGDRVIQLRTPFGGGKTHALLALYHLIQSRPAIDRRDLEGLPDPGPGRVAVLSGIDLDPLTPRRVGDLQIQTLWGELGHRLGGDAGYEMVRAHDEKGSAPAGNVLRPLLGDEPVLILLDEVLVYAERAGGRSGTDPMRRQVLVFLQALTEVVRNLPNAAMVYSLQASVHEAAGDEALLQELDHLVARVNAVREPVSDDEVMRVVQRRLFPTFGDQPVHQEVAHEVAEAYAITYRNVREAFAKTEYERRAAGKDSERFEQRILDSYPFHPALLDLMYHRWGSLPSYQRTRGALQFLARTVHALWHGSRSPQMLIGPGEVALEDEQVRTAFFSQVGERERYSSVLAADVTGGEARSKEVDRRIGTDSPKYASLQVGTRCATGIMLFSFGAREGEERGVLEADLIEALASPELDRNVITTCLHDLREELLYLHHTGRRYRFEPKANLNLLISEESKKWDSPEIISHIRGELERSLSAASRSVVLWPPDSAAVPDREPVFRVVYLGPEWAELDESEVSDSVGKLLEWKGASRREFLNSLAFAVPGRAALDRARTAARLWLAVDSLLGEVKSKRLTIDTEQVDELKARLSASAAEMAGALERLYELVLVPVAAAKGDEGGKPFAFDSVDLRAQLSAGRRVHDRIRDGLRKHVFESLTSARLVSLLALGKERDHVPAQELAEWFFKFLHFPKLLDEQPLRGAIAKGTADVLGYVSAARVDDERVVPSRIELIRFGSATPIDEIDLGPGCYVLSPRLAESLRGEPPAVPDKASHMDLPGLEPGLPPAAKAGGPAKAKVLRLSFRASAAQLFRIMPALQNLADRSVKFSLRAEVEVEGKEPFDPVWLRNAVNEHMDEAGVEAESTFE
jgi:hypothetical protein